MDIDDASSNYNASILSINNDMELQINGLRKMENSLEFYYDNPEAIDAKKSELTHTKLSLPIYASDREFGYKMVSEI